MAELAEQIDHSAKRPEWPAEKKYKQLFGKRSVDALDWKTKRDPDGNLYREPAPLNILGKWAYRIANRMRKLHKRNNF